MERHGMRGLTQPGRWRGGKMGLQQGRRPVSPWIRPGMGRGAGHQMRQPRWRSGMMQGRQMMRGYRGRSGAAMGKGRKGARGSGRSGAALGKARKGAKAARKGQAGFEGERKGRTGEKGFRKGSAKAREHAGKGKEGRGKRGKGTKKGVPEATAPAASEKP